MSEQRDYSQALEIYKSLRQIYASPFPDSDSERVEAVKVLQSADKSDEFLIAKMKILVRNSSQEYKTKLHLVIKGEYWNNQI